MTERYLLLGGTGYVGTAFQAELARRHADFRNVTRTKCDYTVFAKLLSLLREHQPTFVINCAGATGKPNVDACEFAKAETLLGNVTLPQTISHACEIAGVAWGQVSSGCIYSGAMLLDETTMEANVQPDLMRPDVRSRWLANRDRLRGFTEQDPPNFSFRSPPCSFYSGTKALGEEVLRDAVDAYIWRLRIPFDGIHNPRNYLSKICNYPRVYDNANSLSHRADFARACIDLWEHRAPFGIYNVTNPGWVTTLDVAEKLRRALGRSQSFEFFESDEEFYRTAAKAPRSNTILDVSKLLATGVKLRHLDEALDEAIAEFAAAK